MKTMNEKCGLILMVTFHRIIGVSYLGWNVKQNLSLIKRVLLILWNLFFLGLAIIHNYIEWSKVFSPNNLNQDVYRVWGSRGKQMPIVWILENVTSMSSSFLNVLMTLYFLVSGRKLIVCLHEDNYFGVDPHYERRIAIWVIIMSMTMVVPTVIFFTTSLYVSRGSSHVLSILYYLFNFLFFTSAFNTRMIVIGFVFYKSLLVDQQLRAIAEQRSLKTIFKLVSIIHESVVRMDDLINFYILVKLAIDTLICVSSLCIILIYPNENHLANIAMHLGSCIGILQLCLVCQMIPKSFSRFVGDLRKRYSDMDASLSLDEQGNANLLLIRLNNLKQEIGFTAYGMFRIGANTVLSCASLITTYTIIVAQTSPQTVAVTSLTSNNMTKQAGPSM